MTTAIESIDTNNSRVLVNGVESFRMNSAGIIGTVVQRAYAEYTTNADLTAAIPFDDTIPQNTEGTQILSVSITPRLTTSRLRLRFSCQVAPTTLANISAAVFSSASANALSSTWVTLDAAYGGPVALEYEYVPGVTTALSFSVRLGGGGVTFRVNGTHTARRFGGATAATLVVEEIAQ